MNDLRQAAQQALVALEGLFGSPEKWESGGVAVWRLGGSDAPRQAITALRTALEQQQAEPVAYYHPRNGFYWAKPTSIFAPTVVDVPPIPLYTTAAKREWVGLTKEDMPSGEDPMFDHLYFIAGMVYADKVLKKKNT